MSRRIDALHRQNNLDLSNRYRRMFASRSWNTAADVRFGRAIAGKATSLNGESLFAL